jgi:predicted nucleic acid-binding protein
LFITVITQVEILGGANKRLTEVVAGIPTEDFRGRILPFDVDSARESARILAARMASRWQRAIRRISSIAGFG